jgi:hypothetical protein
MTTPSRYALATERIARAVANHQVRARDAIRQENNGRLNERLEEAVARLESIADQLEQALKD